MTLLPIKDFNYSFKCENTKTVRIITAVFYEYALDSIKQIKLLSSVLCNLKTLGYRACSNVFVKCFVTSVITLQ